MPEKHLDLLEHAARNRWVMVTPKGAAWVDFVTVIVQS